MEELLGGHAEPDPLFFVETWTLGVDTAAHNFKTRHSSSTRPDAGHSAFRSFDFSVPVVFVQDVLPNAPVDRQTSMSAGFSAAWRDAYGVKPSSTHTSIPKSSTAREESVPHFAGSPLTAEDACRMLGVSTTSTRKQIKSAYRQLVWRYHPDRFEHLSEQDQRAATDRMTSINEAYRLLCGPTLAGI